MLLTIACPDTAIDLPHRLGHSGDEVTRVRLESGDAHVFFPELGDGRSRAALLYRPREQGPGSGSRLHHLASAVAHAFGPAASMPAVQAGSEPLPVVKIELTPIPGVFGSRWIEMFGPLGWEIEPAVLSSPETDDIQFFSLTLTGRVALGAALNQVYTLLPFIEDDPDYVTVEEGVGRGQDWLTGHPSCRNIVRWHFNHHPSAQEIRDGILPPSGAREGDREAEGGRNTRLYEARMTAVLEALARRDVKTVTDLGCGEGELLVRLMKEPWLERLVGVDASIESLEVARARLEPYFANGQPADRLVLLQGGLTYRDDRWTGSDAVTLIEVIEHIEPERVGTVAHLVFGEARPRIVVVTTPNREFNALFNFLRPDEMRNPDHRFEWTRAEFRSWAEGIEALYGYGFDLQDIGRLREGLGAATQMAVFSR